MRAAHVMANYWLLGFFDVPRTVLARLAGKDILVSLK